MTFFSWIKKQLQIISPTIRPHQERRHNRHSDYYQKKRRSFKNQPESSQTDDLKSKLPESNTQAETTESPTIVTPADTTDNVQQAQVIFSYLDEQNQPIAKADIVRGNLGQTFHFRIPNFSDYYLTSIENFTYQFKKTNQEVTLHFALKDGLPVMIYCLDTDTGQLLKSVQLLSGKIGQAFHIEAPTINGYRVVSSIGDVYGHFDQQTHGLIFAYRRQHWETVQPVEYFVKLKRSHNVFDYPQGRPLRTGLPANVIIKIFARVDLTDQTSWLNIGGFEWIKNINLEPSDPPSHHSIETITKTSRNPVRLSGTINFVPNKKIAYFNQPYGHKIGSLPHGSRVSISATIVDDQGLIWYELANHGIIPKAYVIVDR